MGRKKNEDAAKHNRQKELARERQRRRRANLSEEQLAQKRKKDMERYYRLKQENKIKPVSEKTPREVRRLRKYWRKCSKKYRQKKKVAMAVLENTPPLSPDERLEESQESIQKIRGRKKVRRDKAKVYRTVTKQKNYILELERKVEKYKKRLEREKKKHEKNASPSPRKQVKTLIGHDQVSPKVKKQLFLGFALKKQIESQAKIAGQKTKNQQILCKSLGNEVIKKYRVQKHFQSILPYKMNKTLKNSTECYAYKRETRQCVTYKNNKVIVAFFEDESVSKMCPGKKDFVKKGKLKKQRRILLDSLQNLYKRFINHTSIDLSFSTFARSRPFWVTPPKKSDRDTCACIKHSNIEHMVFALKSNKVITENNINNVVSAVVCSTKHEDCMMGRCSDCAKKSLNFSFQTNFKIKFWRWRNVKEEKVIRDKKKIVNKTVKVKETMPVKNMIAVFNQELKLFKKHLFCQYHQAKQLKNKTKGLKEEELLIRVDFSENYVCKYSEEVQTVHFGASKRQICLNTGIWYAVEEGNVVSQCFATVSDNLDHQAHAIWAHMRPILERAAVHYPNTKTIHFFSDSPSSQYRNRINMHLMKLLVPEVMQNVKWITWNFTAAGHGKGPMDGVGGTLKRMADQHVSHGSDITSSADFIKALKSRKIILKEIKSEEVENLKLKVSLMSIPELKGIMNAYQITYNEGVMFMNSFSCFECPLDQKCVHFMIKKIVDGQEDRCAPQNKKCEIGLKISSIGKNPSKKGPLDILATELAKEMQSDSEDDVIFRPKRSAANVKSYLDMYSSEDDDSPALPRREEFDGSEPGSSGQSSLVSKDYTTVNNIKLGTFVLVRFVTETKRANKKISQFVGVSQSEVEDGEVTVMFLKPISGDKTSFIANDKDVSSIDSKQIVAVLPNPTLMMRGDRVFYKFKYPINVS